MSLARLSRRCLSTSTSTSSSSSSPDTLQWPCNALNQKLVSAQDVLDATEAHARAGATSHGRERRVMTRALIAYGGWVLSAHHVLAKERLSASDIWLPPTPDLYCRAEHESVYAFTDKSVFDVWRQQRKLAPVELAPVPAHASVIEYATGMRLFDALLNSSAVRALAVRSVRVDGDPSLVVPLEPFRAALATAKIERAAAVLTLHRHGKANAAQRYVAQTFAAFRKHGQFFVVDAGAAATPLPLPRSRLFVYTDELLLQDACAKFGLAAPVPVRVLDGAQVVAQLLDPAARVDAMWLNFHTPLALQLPRDLMAELSDEVKEHASNSA